MMNEAKTPETVVPTDEYFSPGFRDWTTEQYHKDPCRLPSLSASIAKELVQRSPAHAREIHPRFGAKLNDATRSTDAGTVIHSLILGAGKERLAIIDVDNFKTKAAQEKRDAALAEGKTVIKADDYEDAEKVAIEIQHRIAAKGIKLDGLSEQKIEWQTETEHGLIYCRSMLDHLVVKWHPVTGATIYDLKTIRSADEKTCGRHIHEYGYNIQEAAYRAGVGAVIPEALGRIDFVFLFVEIEPPFAVTPKRLNGVWRTAGEIKWNRACTEWARGLKTGVWPEYVEGITAAEPEPWMLAQ